LCGAQAFKLCLPKHHLMSDTLMLLSGGHPVHRAFGQAIGAEMFQPGHLVVKSQPTPFKALNLVKTALSVPSSYPYILCESSYFYPALKRRLGLLGKSKIININCGPILQHILSGRVSGLEAKMLQDLFMEVDGHLVFGTFGRALMDEFKVKKPIGIVYPFVSPERFGGLLKQKPNLDSHRICIIATSDAYNKGLDLLFAAVSTVQETFPDVSVDVITRMPEEEIISINKTKCPTRIFRNVADVGRVLSGSALYIQPSRSDIFPVSVIEAMACGLPCIVSDKTGTQEVVGKIDRSMVVKCNEMGLSSSLMRYFNLPPKERIGLSDNCRSASLFFDEKSMLGLFKEQYAFIRSCI
jgi:glycosyltransferase involved in cell wall biosynthesis